MTKQRRRGGLPVVTLPAALKNKLKQGHPWVYRNQIERPASYPSGTWVRVLCGDFEAYGLWDSQGSIAIRIYSRERVPDAGWIRERVNQAWELRSRIRDDATDAYRWIYGEGDGLPGIVVDLYQKYAVLHRYAGSTEVILPWLIDALRGAAPLRGIVERGAGDGTELDTLWGRSPPRDLIVREHGLKFRANLFQGQKTGLFLDQRENRYLIESWSRDRTVLNCFSYTGGFSLYAARGGAKAIVSCEIGTGASEEAKRNFELNGFDAASNTFLTQDAFTLLERYEREGRTFDLVILDPPSLAKSKKSRYAAVRAYARLNRLAMRCVHPGGLLATSSCTSQVTPEMFREMVAEAGSQAGYQPQIICEAGQAIDHPVPAGFPEGRYLKFILARVQRWA